MWPGGGDLFQVCVMFIFRRRFKYTQIKFFWPSYKLNRARRVELAVKFESSAVSKSGLAFISLQTSERGEPPGWHVKETSLGAKNMCSF